MGEAISYLVGVPLYLSGLLVWPMCLIFGPKKHSWKRVRRAFLRCLFFQLALIVFALLPIKIVQHLYEWFFLMIVVNIVFTIMGIIALAKDLQPDS
jgi:hypothetical protein